MKTKELLDKVDINDKIIGTTTKDEAHRQGYAHRVAAIFVFDKHNRLFVQLRKKDGLLDHSAAGHVRKGETYDEAARRELKEELGLTADLNKIGTFYADERLPRKKFQTIHYFGLYKTILSNKILSKMILSKDEVIEMRYMEIKEIICSMINEPTKWTTGFKCTLNFYTTKKHLNLPSIPLR
jgi:isopentenyldiphosphate isomerase